MNSLVQRVLCSFFEKYEAAKLIRRLGPAIIFALPLRKQLARKSGLKATVDGSSSQSLARSSLLQMLSVRPHRNEVFERKEGLCCDGERVPVVNMTVRI